MNFNIAKIISDQKDDITKNGVQGYLTEKGAYIFAILIGVGFFWWLYGLVGMYALIALFSVAIIITIIKIGIVFFL
ncbi:uncharacterized protein METZ01_LOCUS268081 [marine metagenome]|uniref:Uncharacterized protein n=1 Tax=marine metagenome TaxID=408172 RepID=A0A382JW97_9ZZZZ